MKGPAEARHEGEPASPLWMVTREPLLTEVVHYLCAKRLEIQAAPEARHTLTFSLSHVARMREAFARTIRRGEEKLHRLCALLCERFVPEPWDLSSVVIGQVAATGERFVLTQSLSARELYATTDLDLGSRQLRRLRWSAGVEGWSPALLVANYVEYEPRHENLRGIHRLTSRIKAEEEIWNKVVDEIFDLDALVRRDKKLRHLSRYVKDIFGLKVVVGTERHARQLQAELGSLRFGRPLLERHRVPPGPGTTRLGLVEVKDYLGGGNRKGSGWEAIKSVVEWWDATFEIQVQTLANNVHERERLTRESHASFKARRDSLRDETARSIPLFGFYRDLLRWLFLRPDGPAPGYGQVRVELEE